jgi:hypothetical protein
MGSDRITVSASFGLPPPCSPEVSGL